MHALRWCHLGLMVVAAAACADTSDHCDGQKLEIWQVGNDIGTSGSWQTSICGAAGDTCMVKQVEGENFDTVDTAFCGIADPVCDPPTGTRCADATHMITCVDGERVVSDPAMIGQACRDPSPYCVEPAPGTAFCVPDPTPSSGCANQTPEPVEVCALNFAACYHADIALLCAGDTWIACVGGIEVETTTCSPGRCTTTEKSLDVSPCR